MNLDPVEYTCPDHHTDLSDQVRDALEEGDGPPVAYQRRRLLGRAAGPRPFQVIITCPGGAGGSGTHQLACAGTWTR
jgi:hypothetical protein